MDHGSVCFVPWKIQRLLVQKLQFKVLFVTSASVSKQLGVGHIVGADVGGLKATLVVLRSQFAFSTRRHKFRGFVLSLSLTEDEPGILTHD